MVLKLSDKSNYLTGLLVLTGKNINIEILEEKLIRFIAGKLGFNHNFIDESILKIKVRKYIIEELPVFSCREIAEVFIKDAIRFAFVDSTLHLNELQWMSAIAMRNKLSGQWVISEIKYFLNNNHYCQYDSFEIQKHV